MATQRRNEKLIQAIGERLRELREACDMSQEKVLFQTNIHLSRIENGHKNITIGTLVALCDAYHITLKDFFKKLKYDELGTK